MQYGICPLSTVPIRDQAEDTATMLSQLLYGEPYKILEERKFWSRIRVLYDQCEGWIANTQLLKISEEEYQALEGISAPELATDLVSYIIDANQQLLPVVMGAVVGNSKLLGHTHEGVSCVGVQPKTNFLEVALNYLNAPYLSGGKTPFGIDAPGFTQMVYRINGVQLKRQAAEQALQGEALSFIEESEAGDLAFFDNREGVIDHVGIIMPNNYIIHAYGKVRLDRLDHTGIFNTELRTYTHSLRVIKKIV